ncbi:metalloregulator ArsR/SmtB family transcription factor [Paenibacillus sp. SC116]|uniref:ArsR/SmtB family transcription factor n=1 Tax=Paenibacillus sp. SC116 TaxID=2968986 RepID=UPI00215B1DF4|nr:metalloregulator ArsR/SmtB family transcription factor [Paenibacillus sp. SC116]MCR8842975.1 metalloregulator ArsR/SmtB family transcription factor [Paenibacillus sp. SC116]
MNNHTSFPLNTSSSITVELLAAMFRLANHDQLVPQHPSMQLHQDNQLNQYIHEAQQKLPKETLEQIQLFFHQDNACGVSVLPTIIQNNMSIESLLQWIEQLPSNELFLHFLNYSLDPEISTVSELTKSNILERLEQTSLPEKERWKMLYFYADPERMKIKYLELLNGFYEHVFKFWEDELTARLDQSLLQLNKLIQENGVKQLNKALRTEIVHVTMNDLPIHVLPSYFMNTAAFMYDSDEGFICLLGINRLDMISKHDIIHQQIGDSLKVLADEKRIHIIQLLNRAPRYGHELAKELSLTNSTISHHLNALTTTGIVKAIRQENKVYYHADKERIAEVLQHLTQLLTE